MEWLRGRVFGGQPVEELVQQAPEPVVSSTSFSFNDNTYASTYEWLSRMADLRVKTWPMMSSPYLPLAVCLIYVLLYLLGKAFMRNKPVVRFRELTAFALFHNLFMVLLHGYVAWTLSLARFREHASSCSEVFYDEAGTAIAQLLWLFLLAKALAAVGDSYIVIMWKEDHHKDIPHLFFHISDFTLWWIIVMYAPNGQAIPWTFLRSSIDSLLYFTYLLHILVPSSSSSSKRSFFRFLPDRLHQLCDWSHVLVLMLQLLHGLYLLRMCSRLDFNHMVFRNKWLGVILLLQVVMVLVVGVAFDHRGLRTSVLRWLRLRQQKQQQHQKNFINKKRQ